MSEPKRVETNGVKKTTSDSSVADTPKTIRFELDLLTAKLYPEFNYSKLVEDEKKKSRVVRWNGSGAGFDDESDDEIKRKALELERKYGNVSKGSGQNKRRVNASLHDKGSGYDQSDPFIDDGLNYDEHVSDDLEPIHDGFYINSGPLQFKRRSSSEGKRTVSSDSDDSNASDDVDENQKNGPPFKKMKVSKEGRVSGNKETVKSRTKPSADGNAKMDVGSSTTMMEVLRMKRDNLIRNNADAQNSNKLPAPPSTASDESSSSSGTSHSSDNENEDHRSASDAGNSAKSTDKISEKLPTNAASTVNGATPSEPVKLPEKLPLDLQQKIVQLEQLAKITPEIFNKETNELLYEIDTLARSNNVHKEIYGYMAPFLRCSTNKLNVRTKELREKKEKEKLEPFVDELRRGIGAAMSEALKSAAAVNEAADEPRRKFPWNPDLRKIMKSIVASLRDSYLRIHLRRQKDKDTDYIKNYFAKTLLPLWPPNWMQVDELYDEFLKDASQMPKDKTSTQSINLPTVTVPKKSKPATADTTTKSSSVISMVSVIEHGPIEKLSIKAPKTDKRSSENIERSTEKLSIKVTEKRLGANASKNPSTSAIAPIISTAALIPRDSKNNTATNPSNKTMKSNQDQRVKHASGVTKQSIAKTVPSTVPTSIEIDSSPEKNSLFKRASDHSINAIISLPPNGSSGESTVATQYRSNPSNASNAYDNSSVKSKSSSSKSQIPPTYTSNIKHSNAASKHHVESPGKVVCIRDSSSEDEVQFVDDKPKHVTYSSSTGDPKTIKIRHAITVKNDPNANSLMPNAKSRPSKSVPRTSSHPVRDPSAATEDADILNAKSTMNAIIELQSPKKSNGGI